MFSETWLKQERIAHYDAALAQGATPTGVEMSLLT